MVEGSKEIKESSDFTVLSWLIENIDTLGDNQMKNCECSNSKTNGGICVLCGFPVRVKRRRKSYGPVMSIEEVEAVAIHILEDEWNWK